MLKLTNVSLAFDTPVINDVSFELLKGEFIGVVGGSGEGKTTLLKIISGLLNTSSGEILLEGNKVEGPSRKLIPGHEEIKLVNQDFDLDLYHTVKENIREKILFLSKEEREEKIEELLELMEIKHLENQKATNLSGGEQQRLAFARALASSPKVLLLDEPYAHLDFRLKNKIQDYLLDLKYKEGLSVVLVSHNGEEILSVSDKIIHFKKGSVQRIDSPFNFYNFPRTKNEALLFGPVNEVLINNKRFLFRPNLFKLDKLDNDLFELDIEFVGVQFAGAYFINFFEYNGQKLLLYSDEPLKRVSKIYLDC
jgi:ABC-type sulfate/molybdate transport systems ATPase subunit